MPKPSAIQCFGVQRHRRGEPPTWDRDQLAVEEPLEIRVAFPRGGMEVTRAVSVTMRTPGHDAELAVGFLYTEGILTGQDAVREVAPNGADSITVRLRTPVELRRLERHFFTSSSCGVCGKISLEAIGVNRVVSLAPETPRWRPEALSGIPETVRRAQEVFRVTGGLHAAALLDETGRVTGAFEDIGRHNAVDKAVGDAVRKGRDLRTATLFVSGRAGFELVQKALAAHVPFMAAVGAPSSLAVDLARRYGQTLVGFLRDGRFNIYSGFDRVGRGGTGERERQRRGGAGGGARGSAANGGRWDVGKHGRALLRAFLAATVLSTVGQTARAAEPDDHGLPPAVQRTVDANRGNGVISKVEPFSFGNATIYRIEIAVDGVVRRELEVADTGKLIRDDDLSPPDPNEGADDDSSD